MSHNAMQRQRYVEVPVYRFTTLRHATEVNAPTSDETASTLYLREGSGHAIIARLFSSLRWPP